MNIKYCVLHYLPNLLCESGVGIAVMALRPSDNSLLFFRAIGDWIAFKRKYPNADIHTIKILLRDIELMLLEEDGRSDWLRFTESSFSNTITCFSWVSVISDHPIEDFRRICGDHLWHPPADPRHQSRSIRFELTSSVRHSAA